KALGEIEQKIRMDQYVTSTGAPVFQKCEVKALGRITTILARFFPDRVECDIDASGQISKKTVPIPKGVSLGSEDFKSDDDPKVGDKKTIYIFEPTSLTIEKTTTEVLRQDKLKLGDHQYDTFVVRGTGRSAGETLEWLDTQGEMLQTQVS